MIWLIWFNDCLLELRDFPCCVHFVGINMEALCSSYHPDKHRCLAKSFSTISSTLFFSKYSRLIGQTSYQRTDGGESKIKKVYCSLQISSDVELLSLSCYSWAFQFDNIQQLTKIFRKKFCQNSWQTPYTLLYESYTHIAEFMFHPSSQFQFSHHFVYQ